MKSSLLGKWNIDKSTIFDSHLLLMLIPFAFIAFIWFTRNNVKNASNNTKTLLSTLIGFALLSSFVFVFIENQIYSSKDLIGMSAINNLDIFASGIISLGFLSKRYGLVRTLVPIAIVLGATRLINNPGEVLTFAESINAIFLMVLPILVLIITNKNITIKAFAGATLINIVLFIYVWTISKVSEHNFFTISPNSLDKNFFYSPFYQPEIKMLMFILFSFLFEIFIWFIIRYVFWKQNLLTIYSFKISFVNELFFEKELIKKYGKLASTSVFEIEDFSVDLPTNKTCESKITTSMLDELFIEEPEQNFVLPFQLIKSSNNLTRAPSIV